MMISAIFLLFCQQVIAVGTPSPVYVPSFDPAYKADHATVAINEGNDILIAYHANTGVSLVKQVEVAHYKLNPTSGLLTHTSTVVIGGAGHDPLSLGPSISRKCERPDVIAVGDMFFVTWTRIYDAGKKPSVLECAWIKYDTINGLQVFNGQTSPDLGYPLDSDSAGTGSSFHVKECAGVADAFVVSESGGTLRAGVVYSHQTKMSTLLPLDETRRFDMRLVLSEFDINQGTLSAVAPAAIISGIRFDGDTGNSAALILPDAVRGVAADEFWLTYEAQIESGSTVQGKVRLSYVKKNIVGNSWAPQATYVFGTTTAQVLRRPMLFNHKDTPSKVSIAFSRPLGPTTSDVHYSSWAYHSPGLLFQELVSNQFNHVPGSSENRPMPLNATGYRRCYFTRSGQILYYDQDTNQDVGVSSASSNDAFRPAVAMHRGATDDYIATTWEEGSPLRVWILVTD
jgi:hypothetical protein